MELRMSFVVVLVVGIAAMVGVVGGQDIQDSTTEESSTTPMERGNLKIGEKCTEDRNCSMDGGICDPLIKVCKCHPAYPATNHKDFCSKPVPINESCTYDDQCSTHTLETVCWDNRCKCQFERLPIKRSDGVIECKAETKPIEPPITVDPAMIGVLVGMALMFVIICVVLRLFSRARWRENRTIFNTPNPRLMNVSLLRDSKLLHSAEGRRGSRGSMRAPSRQPSMASLRPQSPTQAGGQPTASSRRGSRASNVSPTSNRSNKSPTKAKVPEAAFESVTIEVPQHPDKA